MSKTNNTKHIGQTIFHILIKIWFGFLLMKKIILGLILIQTGILLLLIYNSDYVEAKSDDLRLYSTAAVLMDADSGRVLYQKNAIAPLAMASTTKIMTLIITLENCDLSEEVEVSSYAASMPDVQLNIRQGERYKLKDLTYSLMLESHNDSAVAIAEHVAGSVEAFADMMNTKAQTIGCEDTHFVTPNGLDKDDHHTTAKDLATIMSYCITQSPCKEQFLEITRTQTYSFGDISGKRHFNCTNHNAFLQMMDGALTGKTGFTGKAGYCYVGALKSGERTFIVSLLGCGWPNHKTYKWSDTKSLMQYGIDNYHTINLDEIEIPEEVYEPVTVDGGQQDYVNVELIENEVAKSNRIMLKETEEIEVVFNKFSSVNAPVKKGEILGELCYLIKEKEGNNCENIKGEMCKSITITSAQSIEKINYNWCLKIVFIKFLLQTGAFYVNS